ncbi:carbohydrate ABC transporter permease [Candidatus Aerophobetes bacterium]|nr:carbohydrate ABC transporter permease [Candidatus Aerophobetes bacterium]
MRIPKTGTILQLLGVILIVFLALFPLYWMFNVSLLPEAEVIKTHPHYYPLSSIITFKAYKDLIIGSSIFKFVLNSIIIVFLASLITLFLSFPIAYSIAKYNFKLKKYLQYGIIWLLALPWVVYVLPIFTIVSKLNLLDTHILMIMLYGFSGIPLFSWFILPFMYTFPSELIDAGRLDGCSEWSIVVRIVIPALKNAFIAVFILRFVWAYNDLLYSLSFTFNKAKMIMPAILEIPGYYEVPFAKMSAGGILAVLPILLIVIIFQKYVVSGLTGRTLK